MRGKQAFGMNNVKVANKGKILEGGITLRWVYMQKFRSVSCPSREVREGIKNGRRQNQKCNLGPSALFAGVNHYLSAELTQ